MGILNTLYRWHVQAALMVNTERPCSAVTEVSDTQSFNSASSFYFNNDFRLSCKILLGTCFPLKNRDSNNYLREYYEDQTYKLGKYIQACLSINYSDKEIKTCNLHLTF